MVHHIVMFKLYDTEDPAQKELHKRELKKRLEALPSKIDIIRSMDVGINILKQARAFDVVLVSTFDNLDDLETYRLHPAHREVVSYADQIREQAASVDYEI